MASDPPSQKGPLEQARRSNLGRPGYRFNFLKPHHAYYQNWLEMRRRRKLFFLAPVLAWPVMALLMFALWPVCLLLRSDAPAGVVPFVVMGALPVAWFYWRLWPCPRCGRAYFVGLQYWGSDQCKNCGLARYAPCDPAEQQWEFESHMPEASAEGRK
ncbi:MAG TPA: hypothetical protein VIK18_09860 [Pirellulales bacterium]